MSIIKVLGVLCLLVSLANACENQHVTGMLTNKWDNIGTYVDANVDANLPYGDDASFTTTNSFNFLGSSGNAFTVADNGGLYFGDVSTAGGGSPADISALSALGNLANTGVLAPAWYSAAGALTEIQYEWRVILTSEQGMDNPNGDDTIFGDYWCELETIQESLYSLNGVYEFPEETVVVTWRFFDGTVEYLTQLVLVYTDQRNTYSLMYENGTPSQTPTLRWVGNGVYASTANPVFATVCDAGNGLDLAGLANSFCGKKDAVMWSLDAGDECIDPAICTALDVNLEARNINCNELIVPADSCHINGTCQYVTPLSANAFKMSFVFSKDVVEYASWAVLETPGMTLLSAACLISQTDITDNGNSYTVEKEFPNAGACNIGVNAGTGVYTIILLNYDAYEAVTSPSPAWKGYEIYKAGYRMYQIQCRPDDFPISLVQSVTIGNDIYETTVDATSDRTLTLGFGTMLDGTNGRFTAFASDTVPIGTPLFPYVEFNPGSQYVQNVVPYAVYIKECWFANAVDFSDKKRLVVQNRCRRQNIGAFKLLDEIQGPELADLTFGGTMRVVGGPVRAARWIDKTMIWLQCEVEFCTNTAFYESSYCYNSCTGQGADAIGNRKRRNTEEDTSVILTTHIKISDEPYESSQESCADSTMAYAAISALVVMLLVATVIAVLLAVKLHNKKRA